MNGGTQDVLRLPAVLDLAAAEGFLGTVCQRVEAGQALCLDACEVETLTLPCIQIILAASASHKVSIVNPSAAFASAFHDLALDWKTNDAADAEPQADTHAGVEPAPAEQPAPAQELAPAQEPAPEPAPAQEPACTADPDGAVADAQMAAPVAAVDPEPVVEQAPDPAPMPTQVAEPAPTASAAPLVEQS